MSFRSRTLKVIVATVTASRNSGREREGSGDASCLGDETSLLRIGGRSRYGEGWIDMLGSRLGFVYSYSPMLCNLPDARLKDTDERHAMLCRWDTDGR